MNNTTVDYDHYFALGYETKEQVDLLLKYNSPQPREEIATASLGSHTDGGTTVMEGRAAGRVTSGTVGYGIEISMAAEPADTTLLNKFQVDFDVLGLPPGLDPYNPGEIDISVKFVNGATVLYVNAYYGTEYTRNLCALPDATYAVATATTPFYEGVANMYVTSNALCQPNNPSTVFQWQSINSNAPGGDPAYLTMPVAGWHARFAPPATGLWTYTFLIGVNGGLPSEHDGPFGSFNAGASTNPGYLGATNRNFKFTGPSQDIFIPMGSLGVSRATAPYFNRSLYAMCTHAIQQLAVNNGNHLRIFCTDGAFGIEGSDPGVAPVAGNYDYGQDRAFDLDDIIAYAEQNGVYVQLVLDDPLLFFPADTILWPANPYSSFIDAVYPGTFGPITSTPAQYDSYAPGLFFTDDTCREYYKRKLRYIMARWGYSTHVFAFEFFNEVTNAFFTVSWGAPGTGGFLTWQGVGVLNDYVDWSSSAHWKAPGYIQVSNWVNEMIGYCNNECFQGGNHMFTISAPGSESVLPKPYLFVAESPNENDFVNLMNIDFYTYHFYDTTQFTDYRINFLAIRANWLYPTKPFIIGEYDLAPTGDDGAKLVRCDNTACYYVYTGSFATSVTPNSNLYSRADFHNALFASILSGCAGAVQPFDYDMAGSPWGGQLAYYKSLVAFLDGEDLDWGNCIAIRNNCYYIDNTGAEAIKDLIVAPNSNYQFNDLPAYILNINITATGLYVSSGIETSLIEVFALQYFQGVNRGKIIGWVKNSHNWWLNLPHPGDYELDDMGYPGYNPNAEIPADFAAIFDVEITITGVCNGTYQVDFFNVYPGWGIPATGDPEGNSGILASVTATSICNTLTFTVPLPLDAIKDGTGPIAPDYGFKATPVALTWGYGYLGVRPPAGVGPVGPAPFGLQPFAVGATGKLVAYANIERELLIYTRDSVDVYSWTNKNLSGINTNFRTSFDCVVALGSNDSQIFYKGADGTLQCAYPDGTTWGYAGFGEHIDGDIGCAANGGSVFFRGIDGDLHFLFWNNLGGPWSWRLYNFTESVGAGFDQKPHPLTNFSVNGDGSLLAYRSNDGKLAIIFEISPWTYSYNWVDVNVGGMVRVNDAGDAVVYTDNRNNLWVYYWFGGAWTSMPLYTASGPINFLGPFDIAPSFEINNGQVYFQGSDGFVHVAFVWDEEWIEGHILCTPEPPDRECMNSNAYIRYNNGTVFYQGIVPSDNTWFFDNFRAYYYGKGDVDDI